MNIQIQQIDKTFGFDPTTIGIRHRHFLIIKNPDEYDKEVGALEGDLIITARDGNGNTPDMNVGKYPNYFGTMIDDYDSTFRYYYFRPLEDTNEHTNTTN